MGEERVNLGDPCRFEQVIGVVQVDGIIWSQRGRGGSVESLAGSWGWRVGIIVGIT